MYASESIKLLWQFLGIKSNIGNQTVKDQLRPTDYIGGLLDWESPESSLSGKNVEALWKNLANLWISAIQHSLGFGLLETGYNTHCSWAKYY